MNWKTKFQGGLIGFVGFMLSPLSWWNDLFVNVPLAVAFAWVVSLIYRPAFEPAVIVGYWLTNVLGFVLMHQGAKKMFSGAKPMPYSRHDLLRDMLTSLAYTLLIAALIKLKLIQPFANFFAAKE